MDPRLQTSRVGVALVNGVARATRRDAALALAVLVASLMLSPPMMAKAPVLTSVSLGTMITMLAAVLGAVPLLWRTAYPVPAFAATAAMSSLTLLVIADYRSVLGTLVCLYAVSRWRSVRTSWAGVAATAIAFSFVIVQEVRHDSSGPTDLATVIVGVAVYGTITLAVFCAGRWANHASREIRGLELDRTRAARLAAEGERRRIARELHDIVAHAVSLMVLQAAGARRVLANDPEAADRALDNVDALGRQAIEELQRLLGVLRADWPTIEHDPGAHAATHADLDDLIGHVEAAGVIVRRVTRGQPGQLDPSVAATAYRVVQESLTNTLKHAGPAPSLDLVSVWSPDQLVLELTNSTTAEHPALSRAGGHGLIGLRERASAVGGVLEVSSPAVHKFRITASLPRPHQQLPNDATDPVSARKGER